MVSIEMNIYTFKWKILRKKVEIFLCLCAACAAVNLLPVLINWPLMKVTSLEEASLPFP